MQVDFGDRAREKLRQISYIAVDVAADAVGVIVFQIGGRSDEFGENSVPESRREAFDLIFNPRRSYRRSSRLEHGSKPKPYIRAVTSNVRRFRRKVRGCAGF